MKLIKYLEICFINTINFSPHHDIEMLHDNFRRRGRRSEVEGLDGDIGNAIPQSELKVRFSMQIIMNNYKF